MGVSVTIQRRRAMKKSYAAWENRSWPEVPRAVQFATSTHKKKTSFTFVVDSLTTVTNEHFAWILILFYVASCCEDHLVDQFYIVQKHFKINKGCVSHCSLAIYIKKYLNLPKEELWKLKYFTMQKYIIFKKSSEGNQNPFKIL
jgi:hypothetical protein